MGLTVGFVDYRDLGPHVEAEIGDESVRRRGRKTGEGVVAFSEIVDDSEILTDLKLG